MIYQPITNFFSFLVSITSPTGERMVSNELDIIAQQDMEHRQRIYHDRWDMDWKLADLQKKTRRDGLRLRSIIRSRHWRVMHWGASFTQDEFLACMKVDNDGEIVAA